MNMDSFIEENFSKSILTLTVCINPQTYMGRGGGMVATPLP